MAASSRLDAPEPDSATTSAPTGPIDLNAVHQTAADDRDRVSGNARRRRISLPNALAAGGLVLALATGGYALQQVRAADAEATATAQREAQADLVADVGDLHETIATPARQGQNTSSALLRHQFLLIAGERPDSAVGDRLVAELREAADELEASASTPLPERPTVLPVATVDPVFARLSGLEEQAVAVAGTYREAADETEVSLAAVRNLQAAAVAYADTTSSLPSTDDPDTVAASWRAEGERLDAYQEAIDAAADAPAAAPLAAAHQQLVTGMRSLTDDALERLGADDIDGYNTLLTDRLGGDDPFGFSAALTDSRSEVADDALAGPLDEARERGLGLLTELEELRRTTPAALAEVP